jgi:hypothetical protein
MAPDDDDERRRRNARDDRRHAAARAAEQSSRFHKALGKGDFVTAGPIIGVPPAGAGSGDPGEPGIPERTRPRTDDEEFRKHKDKLLCYIEWAIDFFPRELLEDWALRLEPLDLARPGAGLAIIDPIRHEYERKAAEPHASQPRRRTDWEHYVPRIGREIEWLTWRLLDAPLKSPPRKFWWE